MKVFYVIRWIFALFLLVIAIIYLKLVTGPTDNSRFIISNNVNPDYIVKGDYLGDIQVLNDSISVHESVAFEKDTLWKLIVTKYEAGSDYGDSKPDSATVDSSIEKYLSGLKSLGWIPNRHPVPGLIKLKRDKTLKYEIGVFDRTKRLTIPLLFTDVDKILDQKNKAEYSSMGDSVGLIKYNGEVDYLLSEKSRIILKAKEGLVQRIFPDARKADVLDENNSAIYYFDNKLIGNSFTKENLMTTTINVELINPLYNNFLGGIVKDWSITKLIVWTIGAFVALFFDKLKEKFLLPIVERIIPSKQAAKKSVRKK